jgi:hypothetical protein
MTAEVHSLKHEKGFDRYLPSSKSTCGLTTCTSRLPSMEREKCRNSILTLPYLVEMLLSQSNALVSSTFHKSFAVQVVHTFQIKDTRSRIPEMEVTFSSQVLLAVAALWACTCTGTTTNFQSSKQTHVIFSACHCDVQAKKRKLVKLHHGVISTISSLLDMVPHAYLELPKSKKLVCAVMEACLCRLHSLNGPTCSGLRMHVTSTSSTPGC